MAKLSTGMRKGGRSKPRFLTEHKSLSLRMDSGKFKKQIARMKYISQMGLLKRFYLAAMKRLCLMTENLLKILRMA